MVSGPRHGESKPELSTRVVRVRWGRLSQDEPTAVEALALPPIPVW